ncbi:MULTISPECIES: MarR family winged helix-turn-helix transcriptional regulator [Actinomadura]|uniref:MarR family transcriptional regulator n=3 Tax=Actinomadura TaxID=1988 RepID=A0A5D0NCY0_9ACTN|nr:MULTISPECIES: MarR family transcriptional regulator [Actinomadura]TYB42202.1 MarR family transcriptional regulator [Actinomadura chibensis]TYC07480.1 MarR family transcriptional regulator [Actinomadura syzygii]TYK44328.1 MarR family transcriptional regulator [Actinomadura decatromicini]
MNAQPSPSADPAAQETELLPIRELLSYRLHRVANALSRSAALRYRREFNVSLQEWRTIALLGADEPLTVNRLARLAGLDKAQMSRVASKLAAGGLVEREPGPGRTTQLTLTRSGRALYRGLIGAANERNNAFLVCLTPLEQEVLDSALRKLATLAKALERSER